jgi:hypothetical protein
MAKRAGTDIVQLKLRIRETVRARLAAAAKLNGVSLNSEIAKRLEASFTLPQLDELVDRMGAQLEARDKANTGLPLRTQKERK